MSKIDEQNVSNLIAEQLHIRFQGTKFKLNGWGNVDNWTEIDNGVFLFLEVETSQKHPNTNVLKLWPYLEENKRLRVFLIQTYFPKSPGLKSNRGRLSVWTANQLMKIFDKRFEYHRLVIDGINDVVELRKIKNKIDKFIKR